MDVVFEEKSVGMGLMFVYYIFGYVCGFICIEYVDVCIWMGDLWCGVKRVD